MTPMKSIRARCLDCSGGSSKAVSGCPFKDCPLYEYRQGHRPTEKILTPMKAIRSHCISCCDGNVRESSLCTAKMCPVHAFRTGKKPKGYDSPTEPLKAETMPVDPIFLASTAITGGINL